MIAAGSARLGTVLRTLATLPGMDSSRRVYSSEDGRIRPPVPARSPAPTGPPAPNDGVVRIFRDRRGRNGKVVTVIRGLTVREVEGRAAALKRLCGVGGAIKDGAIEIQGDHRERITEHLRGLGHTVKLAGG
jgi:translation initiation factor 1